MNYQNILITLLLFLFSVLLFPTMNTAIEAVSISEPLQPFIAQIPIVWLGSLLLIMGYEIVGGKE